MYDRHKRSGEDALAKICNVFGLLCGLSLMVLALNAVHI